MNDPLKGIGAAAQSGLRAQAERLRIVAENLANAETTATTAGGDPYRRKTISFEAMLDPQTGAETVAVRAIEKDQSHFRLTYDPAHPAADAEGYVKRPNVQPLMEMANMREASRSYEANLNMIEAGRRMRSQLLDLLS